MAYFKHPATGHLTLITQTAFSTLGQDQDGQHQVGLVVAYGSGPAKVYSGATQELAQAAAEQGLHKLTSKIEGGDVIIVIDDF